MPSSLMYQIVASPKNVAVKKFSPTPRSPEASINLSGAAMAFASAASTMGARDGRRRNRRRFR